MLEKVWKVLPAPPDGFADTIGLPPFDAQLLYNRGLRTADEAAAFLKAGDELAHDPFLLPDMDKAASRLRTAVLWDDTVGVFGDFDTDGISGTAIVVTALESLGLKVVPYLPHRVDEGHGLNIQAVSRRSLLTITPCRMTRPKQWLSSIRAGATRSTRMST